MRVAAVIHQFPPAYTTGTEVLCLHSARALAARGHEVCVFTGDPATRAGGAVRHDAVEGISVHRFGTARPRRLLLSRRIIEEFTNPTAASQLLSELRRFQPDVIHLFQSQQFGLATVPEMAVVAPVLATVTDFHLVCPLLTASFDDGSSCPGPGSHGAVCITHLKQRETRRLSQESGLKRAGLSLREMLRRGPWGDTPARLSGAIQGRIAAAAKALASIDLTLIGPPRLYAMLHGNPDASELFGHAAPSVTIPDGPVGETLCVGYFGSLAPHKGLHVLLDAVAMIPHDCRMTFIICGPPGPDAAYAREITARAAADSRISLRPGVPHSEYGALMAKADIVVVPSLWDENNPLVLLDALEAGRYAVVSDTPGMAAAIEAPDGGCAFPAGDADALAARLQALAHDPAPVIRARSHPVRRSQFETYMDGIVARYETIRARRRAALATTP